MQTDKILHAETCYLITTLVGRVTGRWYVGVVVGMLAAIGKEIYDYYNPESHTAELGDIYADLVGIALGAVENQF